MSFFVNGWNFMWIIQFLVFLGFVILALFPQFFLKNIQYQQQLFSEYKLHINSKKLPNFHKNPSAPNKPQSTQNFFNNTKIDRIIYNPKNIQMSTLTLTSASTELQQIKQICTQGRQVNNMQIRSMFTSLASNIQNLLNVNVGNEDKKKNKSSEMVLEKSNANGVVQFEKKEFYQQLDNITKIMIQKNTLLDDKIQKIYTSLNQQVQSLRKHIETNLTQNYNTQLHALQGKLTKYTDKKVTDIEQISKERLKKYEDLFNKEIDTKMEELRNKVSILQEKVKLVNIGGENKLKPVDAKEWVDPGFCQFKNLVLNANNIKINAWTDIYGLPKNKPQFTFTIKIQRLQGKKMAIGIVDSKLKTSIKPSNSHSQIYYHSGAYYWNGKNAIKQKNGGYDEGDYVTVIVNLKNGTTEWRVNGEKKYCVVNQALKNEEIIWVPFLFLKEKDDSVSIFE